MAKLFCPNGHPTITARFTTEELSEVDITLQGCAADADIIVAALLEELAPLMQQFRTDKKYLLWCDEPLWSNIFQKLELTRTAFLIHSDSTTGSSYVPVDAMNCFTGNVLFSNYHFLLDIYHLDMASFTQAQVTNLTALPQPPERKIAAFLTYRNGGFWDFKHPSGVQGLNTLRSRVALEGALFGKVDVYGQGWPMNLAKPEEGAGQKGANLFWLKIRQYEKYKFALCFENTWSPYYVTEKIWQAILAGCLPVYFAGPQHTIYQDFPKDSFIDYFDFEHPAQLFALVESMQQEEFDRRLSLCKTVLFNAIQLSNDGNVPRRLQRAMFAERVHALLST
ncbi:MAG: hypothetical protein IPN53_19625 [Comamonadaceae bacterium]|nr:hypothetical protein [Comamonadaceae bacterium]